MDDPPERWSSPPDSAHPVQDVSLTSEKLTSLDLLNCGQLSRLSFPELDQAMGEQLVLPSTAAGPNKRSKVRLAVGFAPGAPISLWAAQHAWWGLLHTSVTNDLASKQSRLCRSFVARSCCVIWACCVCCIMLFVTCNAGSSRAGLALLIFIWACCVGCIMLFVTCNINAGASRAGLALLIVSEASFCVCLQDCLARRVNVNGCHRLPDAFMTVLA